jgi:hypothetical protein
MAANIFCGALASSINRITTADGVNIFFHNVGTHVPDYMEEYSSVKTPDLSVSMSARPSVLICGLRGLLTSRLIEKREPPARLFRGHHLPRHRHEKIAT